MKEILLDIIEQAFQKLIHMIIEQVNLPPARNAILPSKPPKLKRLIPRISLKTQRTLHPLNDVLGDLMQRVDEN
jgi:hypothetical protein